MQHFARRPVTDRSTPVDLEDLTEVPIFRPPRPEAARTRSRSRSQSQGQVKVKVEDEVEGEAKRCRYRNSGGKVPDIDHLAGYPLPPPHHPYPCLWFDPASSLGPQGSRGHPRPPPHRTPESTSLSGFHLQTSCTTPLVGVRISTNPGGFVNGADILYSPPTP